jgi:hypothetical protein
LIRPAARLVASARTRAAKLAVPVHGVRHARHANTGNLHRRDGPRPYGRYQSARNRGELHCRTRAAKLAVPVHGVRFASFRKRGRRDHIKARTWRTLLPLDRTDPPVPLTTFAYTPARSSEIVATGPGSVPVHGVRFASFRKRGRRDHIKARTWRTTLPRVRFSPTGEGWPSGRSSECAIRCARLGNLLTLAA